MARDPLPAHVAMDLARRAEALDHAALRVRVREGGEAIHDLRVACRRLDEALATWQGGLPVKPARALRRELRRLRRSVGGPRDAEVRYATLRELSRRVSRPERAGALPLLRELSTVIAHRHREAARATREARVERIAAHVMVLAGKVGSEAERGGALRAAAHAHLAERRDALRTARAALRKGRRGDTARVHEARLCAKKARYALECLADARLPVHEPELDRARALQKRLGTVCDLADLAGWLAGDAARIRERGGARRAPDGRARVSRDAARRAWLARVRDAHRHAIHALGS